MTDMTAPTIAVIVVAAGSGSRLGHAEPKAFVPLAGKSILERALEGVLGMRDAVQLIVVAPADRLAETRQISERAASARFDQLGRSDAAVVVVAGGATRQESVQAGLAALSPGIDTVLVHDA
ncbi:2-C-methyl-D-erythritol 4-phosphate cytidylyltransferase, partial [Leifsonia psychrotolerans]